MNEGLMPFTLIIVVKTKSQVFSDKNIKKRKTLLGNGGI